ncbi:hypothetical protein [Bizionia arctica]|uniref:Uncharacterized protein n=1 Tax=Bizionia arctica TaxID=1495645 RepID=A0A917LN99_9FLAO|nr:hypothetical protein [Bizionia arctica]GGG45980.1 hypothetical protein GCM10010976_16950 [Bizionia arctica]
MNIFIIILTGVFGATLTFYVGSKLNQGAVRASALLSLIVGLFFYCFPVLLNEYLTNNIPVVFFGTSFIGMVSPKMKGSYLHLALAGMLFSIVYFNESMFFEGYGGALGALAFITLIATMGSAVLFSNNSKIGSRISALKKWMSKDSI